MKEIVNIAIFASGGGTNAEAIIQHFKGTQSIIVKLIVVNSAEAGILKRAENHSIKSYIHTTEDAKTGKILDKLRSEKIDFIVLAGYLKKIGDDLIRSYPNKIINVHPALLPKFGGKGMFGANVHKAVLEAGEIETGITIHFVNEEFDKGQKIAQFHCALNESDDLSSVQKKISQLEQTFLPTVVEATILK